VPPSFRCDPIIDKASQLLQKAESELRDLNQRRLTLQQQINQLEQQVKQTLGQLKALERYGNAEKVTIRDHRGGATTTRVIHVKEERNKFNQELGQLQRDLADQSAKRTAEDSQVKEQSDLVEELKEALEEWKSLSSSEPDGDRMFILGFICERLPKSPDPDPQLFAA
jgi:chromosome segregation ATPase